MAYIVYQKRIRTVVTFVNLTCDLQPFAVLHVKTFCKSKHESKKIKLGPMRIINYN